MDMGKKGLMKPIFFNDEMVRAILDGRKTQTRRPLKPQPDYLHDADPYQKIWMSPLKCPYGKVGDRLWVREAFTLTVPTEKPMYRATWKNPDGIKWTSSIHMPRWASRITLEITDIRIERVQEITEEEAEAEGVLPCPHPISKTDECLDCYLDAGEYACSFFNLWDQLYAKKGLGVDDNPWVWVITFRRIKG